MKKFIASSLVMFAFACNSGETTDSTENMDSAVNSNTEKNMNGTPLRTRDTTTNLMKDSLGYIPDPTVDSPNRR